MDIMAEIRKAMENHPEAFKPRECPFDKLERELNSGEAPDLTNVVFHPLYRQG
jgi:hypothetical protein